MRILRPVNDDFTSTQLPDRAPTRASMVYERLRHDILNGRLEPGRRLRMKALKERYDVGHSPLREALNRLTASGLIDQVDGKGFQVSITSADELQELSTTRCWLEEIALRRSINAGDAAWEERVLLACHRLSKLPRAIEEHPFQSSPAWDKQHGEYHTALISACGSRILIGYCEQLQDRMLRYRSLAAAVARKKRSTNDEHQAIQDAALDRDSDLAVELLTAHYRKTGKIVASTRPLDTRSVGWDDG